MPETYLFDIPFYWRKEDRFNREYERDLANHLTALEKQTGYPLTDNLRMSLTDGFWRRYIAPWRSIKWLDGFGCTSWALNCGANRGS